MLDEMGFSTPIHVQGRASIADLFKPGKRCGIYILYFQNGEMYAGKALDVTRRYVQHSKKHGDIERIAFKRVPKTKLDLEERPVIERLERSGKQLRNIVFASIPKGESDFDLVMEPAAQERWLQDMSYVDADGPRLISPDLRRKYAKRFQDFQQLPYAEALIDLLQTYVKVGLPAFRRGEVSFWGVSCLASGTLARVNIFWQEVFAIGLDKGRPYVSLYLADSLIKKRPFLSAKRLWFDYLSAIKTNNRYKPGGSDQLNFQIDDLGEAKAFICDPRILPAIRLFNFRLMKKGPCTYGRYHCMDLADYLVGDM